MYLKLSPVYLISFLKIFLRSPDYMTKTINNSINKSAICIGKIRWKNYANISNYINIYYVNNLICKTINVLDENILIKL